MMERQLQSQANNHIISQHTYTFPKAGLKPEYRKPKF